ncbi:D-alanine--D-alanine ligase [Candidatus Saccharibacteria bacterium]|nr:D-alanine--D-alanine ligase [Candidatus Saccharibacteria bacterium]
MKTVAVIFGGQSTEHDVSIVTAISSIIRPLELTKKYKVEPVYIAKNGSWYWDQKLKDISLYQGQGIEDFLSKAPKTHLLFDNGLTLVKSSQFAGRKQYKKIDIVFPAMHGTHGEDGELMGILEMAGVPYVGCGVSASAVAMDKVLSKQVTQSAGIASTPWTWFYSRDLEQNHTAIINEIQKLKYPLFVKPAHLGSSIGITKVNKKSELMNALEVAGHYDDKVIVEQAVQNLIEVTLPIIGNEQPVEALLEQPLVNADQFFDFETKYMNQGGKKGGKKMDSSSVKRGAQGYSNIPAELPKKLYEQAVQMGIEVYKVVGCEGIARIDMLIDDKAGKVMFNEINPLPGSLYSHNWRVKGYSPVDLVSKLVDYGLQRHARLIKRQTAFTTSFLKQF